MRRLYLDAPNGPLTESPPRQESSVACARSRTGGADEPAIFTFRFGRDSDIVGGMRLRLWIAAEEADDADVFVGVEKLSPTGALVGFSGYQGVPNDVMAKVGYGSLMVNWTMNARPRRSPGTPTAVC